MARSHGKILASAWNDEDFTGLPPRLQWMYWTLLGQPKLTLVGCMDFMPARWARLSDETSTEYVKAQIADLESRGYVLVDDETDELLIRTLPRHDGIAQANANIRKGMWGAWRAIQSPMLRKVAVDNMPPEVWEIDGFDVPEEAVAMASEPPFEWTLEPSFEPPLEQAPELTCLPSPVSCEPPTPAVATLDPYETPKIPVENIEQAKSHISELRARRSPHEGEAQARGGDGLVHVNGQANPTEAM